MNKTQVEHFWAMLFDRKYLVIKTAEGKQPVVIAECYLPEISALICRILTNHANEETTKENGEIKR